MSEAVRDDFINSLFVLLQSRGILNDELKNSIYIILNDYEISLRETGVIKYTEDENMKLLQRFIVAKQVAGRSKKTLLMYTEQCKRCLEEIQKPVRDITADDIRYFLAVHQMRDNWQKSTADNMRRFLKSFFTWLYEEEIIPKNPMLKVERIKETKRKKEAFSDMEIAVMRQSIEDDRERALFEFMLSTWCRVSEVAEVKISDIKGEYLMVHGKGDKYRRVYLNANARIAINRYLEARNDNNPYLFIARRMTKETKAGKGITSGAIEDIIRQIGERNGIKAHPHKFRRTGATMALRHGMDLVTVSKILGHTELSTTQLYLDLDDTDIAQQHHKYVT